MIIKEYQDNYLSEVIQLFVDEYAVDFEDYKAHFIRFFEHPFQKSKCLRIVTLDDAGIVVGFQSFFYWPYRLQGDEKVVYQSGSSIVSKKARGKGLFQRMLDYAGTVREKYGIDFFIGFPVEASYKSFIANGWKNPFDLHWHVKIKNPFGFLFSFLYASNHHLSACDLSLNAPVYKLGNSRGFMDWRQSYQKGKYRVFTFRKGTEIFEVNHKVNRRKRIINELIIGEILCRSSDEDFIRNAYKAYYKWLFFQIDIGMISFCTNNADDRLSKGMIEYGLKPVNRKIHFITKYADTFNSGEWLLYRSDIDTW